ncbi:cystathionine beta-lyase [Nocardia transvalensis]|uniref:cysteine-S-conjugate beta-lyase n=1 Tax=Nocardia transvalensis TaxID=37333 RepID=A0A7W9PBE0_9NOCA|nr:aminotransferase class I/II-fold pyridoxal phosphate-dependent enzyme [Nocardia transvalensis]MBB5912997.1 cystathionine beta-lyase [Nocardia transvalensis]
MTATLVPLDESELRRRRSLKWCRTAPDTVPFDIAEADFAVAEPVRDTIVSLSNRSDLGYPDFDSPRGGPARLAELFSARTFSRYRVPVDPARVEICAQIMQALCCALLAFSAPGDHVLTHTPTYPPIREAVRKLGRRLIVIDAFGSADEERFAGTNSLSDSIKMIILCQPHNPTGRIFEHGELKFLAEIAERDGAVIFADEIHQDLGFDKPHESIASIDAAHARTILFTSAAKSFNIAGLRCATGYFGSSELHTRFRSLPWHLRGGAGVLGIEATITAWSECDDWLEDFRSRLRENRDLIFTELAKCPKGAITAIEPDATYFAWLGIEDISTRPDNSPTERLRPAFQPGSLFGEVFSGHIRLNFATTPERVLLALAELRELINAPDCAPLRSTNTPKE